MSVKQVSVFVENKPGALYSLTGVLSQHQIDLRAVCVAESSEFGILRLIVDDPDKTAQLLQEAGYVYHLTQVLAVAIPDVPGGLNRVMQVLLNAGINVEYLYAFLGTQAQRAYMILRVEDNDAATSALQARGIQALAQEEMDQI